MPEKTRVNVNIDHSETGFFTDNVTISHNSQKFIFDFVQVTPRFDRIGEEMQQTLTVKHNTLIMDPLMAKSIFQILKDNLEKYEKNFGELKLQKRKPESKPVEYSDESTKYIG